MTNLTNLIEHLKNNSMFNELTIKYQHNSSTGNQWNIIYRLYPSQIRHDLPYPQSGQHISHWDDTFEGVIRGLYEQLILREVINIIRE